MLAPPPHEFCCNYWILLQTTLVGPHVYITKFVSSQVTYSSFSAHQPKTTWPIRRRQLKRNVESDYFCFWTLAEKVQEKINVTLVITYGKDLHPNVISREADITIMFNCELGRESYSERRNILKQKITIFSHHRSISEHSNSWSFLKQKV